MAASDKDARWNESTAIEPIVRDKNPAAVALGRLGGKKGGVARAEKLSAERRTEIARKAAQTRWTAQRSMSSRKSEA